MVKCTIDSDKNHKITAHSYQTHRLTCSIRSEDQLSLDIRIKTSNI